MEAYKFETRIPENGIFHIPEISKYNDREVEIIVMLKPQKKVITTKPEKTVEEKTKLIDDFFAKWSGKFSTVETDDVRYNALMEKAIT